MVRSVVVGAGLVVIGAAAASVIMSSRAPTEVARYQDRVVPPPLAPAGGLNAVGTRANGDRSPVDVQQRLQLLEARLVEEAAQLQRLQAQLEAVTAQLAALGGSAAEVTTAPAKPSAAPLASDAATVTNDSPSAAPIDYSKSTMERALTAAGLDAATAADIKRRHDALAMSEMYLRDQATREQWLDTPRFAQELAAIQAQQMPMREELGDEAYDRYLFALGHTNRVRVDDVMLESPAAQAGLQTGDMILRYGDARIFAPDELVAQTRSGATGESVRLEIIRNGERLEVEVPRGPLGLRIAATQDMPENS